MEKQLHVIVHGLNMLLLILCAAAYKGIWHAKAWLQSMSGTAADGARRHHEEGRMDLPFMLLSQGMLSARQDGGADVLPF